MNKENLIKLGISEEQVEQFKLAFNFATIIEKLKSTGVIDNIFNDFYERKCFEDNDLYNLVIKAQSGEEYSFNEKEVNMLVELAQQAQLKVIEYLKGELKERFKFKGYNKTSTRKSIHIPYYIDMQNGYFTAGRSGVIDMIDMHMEINVIVTRKVRATKNKKGLVEGFYTVRIVDEE